VLPRFLHRHVSDSGVGHEINALGVYEHLHQNCRLLDFSARVCFAPHNQYRRADTSHRGFEIAGVVLTQSREFSFPLIFAQPHVMPAIDQFVTELSWVTEARSQHKLRYGSRKNVFEYIGAIPDPIVLCQVAPLDRARA
ncbi:uncharacterized protein METZ01_LOCUS115119, partial [marine metagenome]